MPEEFLDLPQGPATGQDLAGHGVTKTMGVHPVQAGDPGVSENDVAHPCPVQGPQGGQEVVKLSV